MGFASERAACLSAGIGADGLRTVRKGSAPKISKIAKLAPVLGVSTQDLIDALNDGAFAPSPAAPVERFPEAVPETAPTIPPDAGPDMGEVMGVREVRDVALMEIQAALDSGRKDRAALLTEAFLHDLLADIARDKARTEGSEA